MFDFDFDQLTTGNNNEQCCKLIPKIPSTATRDMKKKTRKIEKN